MSGARTARRELSAAVDPKEWIFTPAPAIVDSVLSTPHRHSFVRMARVLAWGIQELAILWQGLTCSALCGYAFYGRTVRQRGRGRILRDFSQSTGVEANVDTLTAQRQKLEHGRIA